MRHEIFDALLLISCAIAFWKGGAPERWVALTLLAGDALSIASVLLHAGRYRHEEYGLLATDLLTFAALAAIAFHSTRWWPLVLAGLQLDGVLVHFIHFVAPHTIPIAYLDATAMWSYPMVLLLPFAVWRHQIRLKGSHGDPAWKRARARHQRSGRMGA